jgi:hypothetical protein
MNMNSQPGIAHLRAAKTQALRSDRHRFVFAWSGTHIEFSPRVSTCNFSEEWQSRRFLVAGYALRQLQVIKTSMRFVKNIEMRFVAGA